MDEQQTPFRDPNPVPSGGMPQAPQQSPLPMQQMHPQSEATSSWDQISGQPSAQAPKSHPAKRLLLISSGLAVIIVVAGVIIHTRSNNDSFASTIKNGPDTSHLAPVHPATSDTALGQTAEGSGGADGLAITVERVLANPPVSGDPADPGTEYLEVDLYVKNSSKYSAIVPGTFYYQTSSGELLSTATSVGDKKTYANKSVEVTGKASLDDLSLDAGQADSTHYLIFQIPASEIKGASIAGKMVWYEGYYDTSSPKLAILSL